MKIFIASDHAAFEQKAALIKACSQYGEFVDLGPNSNESVHYPDYASKVCLEMKKNPDSVGILLCGSGIGMSMVANKFKNVRAALCKTTEDAKLSKNHNNANVLCLGARSTPLNELIAISKTWFESSFEAGRHLDRINMFSHWGKE